MSGYDNFEKETDRQCIKPAGLVGGIRTFHVKHSRLKCPDLDRNGDFAAAR